MLLLTIILLTQVRGASFPLTSLRSTGIQTGYRPGTDGAGGIAWTNPTSSSGRYYEVPYTSRNAEHFGNISGVYGGKRAGGRTFINSSPADRIRQDGVIRQVSIYVRRVGKTNTIKFKVFRASDSGYEMVSESETLMVAPETGIQTFSLATPMDCEIGDMVGFYLPADSLTIATSVVLGGESRFADGDITTADPFSTTLNIDRQLNVAEYGKSPYLVVTGDSIAEGHNTANDWHSFYDVGIGGNPTSEIANQLRILDGTIDYQNHAKGSETFAWVASTGIVSAAAAHPLVIIIHCGINDIRAGRTWEQIEIDLNTIRATVPDAVLFLDEILPRRGGSNEQAVLIRSYNANLATWAAANNAHMIHCHDLFGQVRLSTGKLDDLHRVYSYDGVHLNQAGVDDMAVLWLTAIKDTFFPSGHTAGPASSVEGDFVALD